MRGTFKTEYEQEREKSKEINDAKDSNEFFANGIEKEEEEEERR